LDRIDLDDDYHLSSPALIGVACHFEMRI